MHGLCTGLAAGVNDYRKGKSEPCWRKVWQTLDTLRATIASMQ